MKRLITLLSLSLLLSSCAFGAMHPTLFNNKVVELISPATLAVEDSALSYNDLIPDEITELTEVDTLTLRTDFELAENLLEDVTKALDYESENLEQQATVRAHLETYILASDEYLENYEIMLDYFEAAENQTDPNRLDSIDPALHTTYNTFTEANNDLVTSLASFVEIAELDE